VKVVLTGEGADEFLGGYNIFKENNVRRFWARQPDSSLRPLLLQKLYGYVGGLNSAGPMRQSFFSKHLTEVERLDYSHLLRWANSASICRLFSHDLRDRLGGYEPRDEIGDRLATHSNFRSWTPLAQAQYLEATLFMSGYLLSSQGDRMLMAHSVEGRFPFLDHRVIEWAAQMPPRLKLRGLNEKWVLKEAVRSHVPASVIDRPKQPYRAPIRDLLIGNHASWVKDVVDPREIADVGVFEPNAVTRLMAKASRATDLSERDNMALMAVVSTQLLHRLFARGRIRPERKPTFARRITGTERWQ
jgi:asparagine synthase (glutamine-hydrolysing)